MRKLLFALSLLIIVTSVSSHSYAQDQLTYSALSLPNQFTAVNYFQVGLATGPLTFAQLTAIPFPQPGTTVLCSGTGSTGCTSGSNPCTIGSSQVIATYLNGAWNCSGGGGGSGGSNMVWETQSFVNVPSVIVPTTFTALPILPYCWDSNNIPVSSNPPVTSTSTPYTVTFTFSSNQSGYCGVLGSTSVTPPPPPSGVFSVTPSSVPFGNVALTTTSAPAVITLANNSLSTVTGIGFTVTSANPADFLVFFVSCGNPLAPSAVCAFQVQFRPSLTTPETATLTITSSAPTQTVSLSGTGYNAASISIAPTGPLTFGSVLIGTTSPAQALTLTNNGTGLLLFSTPTVTGTNAGDFVINNPSACLPSLGQTLSCQASISFVPTASGARTASLNINDNVSGSPQTISLSGTGAINNAAINALVITPPNSSIILPGTQQFVGTATYTNSTTLSTASTPPLYVNWGTSSGSSYSTIISTGNQEFCNAGGNISSTTCASKNMVAGNALLMFESIGSASVALNAPTMTDSGTIVQIGTNHVTSGSTTAAYCAILASGGGTPTANVVVGHSAALGAGGAFGMAIIELSGVASCTTDGSEFSTTPGSATVNLTTPNLITTFGQDGIVCFGVDVSTSGITANSPYTQLLMNGWADTLAVQLNVAPATFNCNMTDATASTAWVDVGVALKAAGGSTGSGTINSAGLATAVAAGNATILAGTGGYQGGGYHSLTTSASSIAASYNYQGAGDLDVVIVGWGDTSSPAITVTDTSGNTYIQAANSPIAGTGVKQAIYYSNQIYGALPGANTVTVSFSTAVTNPQVGIFDYPLGIPSGSLVQASVSSSGTSLCGTSITTTATPALVISAWTASTAMSTAPSPFISRLNQGNLSSSLYLQVADNGFSNNTSYFAPAGPQVTTVTTSGNCVNSTIAFNVVSASTTWTVNASTTVNNYYVNGVSGSNSNNGLTPSTAWKTVEYAINSANTTLGTAGETIFVAPGTYSRAQMTTGEDTACAWSGCSLYHYFVGLEGSATQPILFTCAVYTFPPACILEASDNVVQEGIISVGQNGSAVQAVGGDYVTVIGFEFLGTATGADSSHYTQAGVELNCTNCALKQSWISHILKYTNDGAYGVYAGFSSTTVQPGYPNGCASGSCPTNSQPWHYGQTITGNVITDVGTPAADPSFLNSSVSIYGAAPNETISNNIIYNNPAVVISQSCITANHWGIGSIITNNTINCGDNGGSVDVHMYDSPFTGALNLTTMTYGNNVIINACCVGYQFRESTGNNALPLLFTNNACDTTTCFVNTNGGGSAFIGTQTGTLTSINPATFFRGWNAANQYPSIVGGGTDYSLTSASPGYQSGSTACVTGQTPPCSPPTNILGQARGATPNRGAF